MISKDTIKRTSACYWSVEDECFVVESPLFDRVAGTGESEQKAMAMFEDMLDSAYEALKIGKVIGYGKIGRPSKEGIQLNCKVRHATHNSIDQLARALNISQGEVVDVLCFHYAKRTREQPLRESAILAAVRKIMNEGKVADAIKVKEEATPSKTYQTRRKTVRPQKRQVSR